MKHKWQVLFLIWIVVFWGLGFPGFAGEQKRAVTVDDMHSFKSVDNPDISPDGKKIAFTVSFYCQEKKKKFSAHAPFGIWRVKVAPGK